MEAPIEEVVRTLDVVEAVAFGGLALITLVGWRRRRGEAHAWAAAAFGSLGLGTVAGLVLPDRPDTTLLQWLEKILLVLVVLFPYFLHRFAASFQAPSRWVDRVAIWLTALIVVASLSLPEFPDPDASLPAWFLLYAYGLLIQWTFLFSVVTVRLWRAGRRESTLVRRRMRLLALATAGMNVVILLAVVVRSQEDSGFTVAVQVIGILTALLFALGLDPPRALRTAWRRPEEAALRRSVADLMAADRLEDITETFLPHAVALMGAEGAVLLDSQGRSVASYGATPETGTSDGEDRRGGSGPLRIPLRTGSLLISASPYTPFFGREEMDLLRYLGGLADLALQRSENFDRERQFISNAAHELRTPMSVLSGLASTLAMGRGSLSDEELDTALDALDRHGDRARALIDNLLDLARLDNQGADAIRLEPVNLAAAVKASMEAVPAPGQVHVEVAVDEDTFVLAETARLSQIFANLLGNAYRHGGPRVRVDATTRGDVVEVRVSDDGPGVPSGLVPNLFEAFTRGEDSAGKGSGLGLAIVDRLAQVLGGSVAYEPGRSNGAMFVVRLPRA